MKRRKIKNCWKGTFNSAQETNGFMNNNTCCNVFLFISLMQWEIKLKTVSIYNEKNTLRKGTLNFDQWKTFFESYKPIRV